MRFAVDVAILAERSKDTINRGREASQAATQALATAVSRFNTNSGRVIAGEHGPRTSAAGGANSAFTSERMLNEVILLRRSLHSLFEIFRTVCAPFVTDALCTLIGL